MTKLFLIRHGQTDFNVKQRYCGFSDIELNQEGMIQAEKLHKKLLNIQIDYVYCSDLIRARQTAGIVFKQIEMIQRRDLREMNFGVIEGLRYEEIIVKYPKMYNQWIAAPWENDLDQGESFKDFSARVRRCLDLILADHQDKTIAMVSHAGPIRLILSDLLKNKDFWSIPQDSSAFNVIEYHLGENPKVIILNDTTHLLP